MTLNGMNEKRAEALTILLNMQNRNKEINLSAKKLSDGTFYVSTEQEKIRIFGGDGLDLYKIHIGGTLKNPAVVIKGHTYDGITSLFNSIEYIGNS